MDTTTENADNASTISYSEDLKTTSTFVSKLTFKYLQQMT